MNMDILLSDLADFRDGRLAITREDAGAAAADRGELVSDLAAFSDRRLGITRGDAGGAAADRGELVSD